MKCDIISCLSICTLNHLRHSIKISNCSQRSAWRSSNSFILEVGLILVIVYSLRRGFGGIWMLTPQLIIIIRSVWIRSPISPTARYVLISLHLFLQPFMRPNPMRRCSPFWRGIDYLLTFISLWIVLGPIWLKYEHIYICRPFGVMLMNSYHRVPNRLMMG